MQDIIKNDIKESLEWIRQEYGKHGFDVSQPIQDMDVFFQTQEASMNTLDNEISDIADEYGEESLEVEAAEELRSDVEEGFREVGETTAGSLEDIVSKIKMDMNIQFDELSQKLRDSEFKNEELRKEMDKMKRPLHYVMEDGKRKFSQIAAYAKDFAEKTFDNIKQFCHDRKIDLFKAVDNARMKQNRFLKEFCLNTREMAIESKTRNEERLQSCYNYLEKYIETKKAKKAMINQFLKPFLPKKISEKYFSTDINKIKFDRNDYGYFAKFIRERSKDYATAINRRQKIMDKLENTIDKLDKKAVNIATKWQDKAKEPTQKSFEEKLNQFEKETEMENQNINPQKTQSQER